MPLDSVAEVFFEWDIGRVAMLWYVVVGVVIGLSGAWWRQYVAA